MSALLVATFVETRNMDKLCDFIAARCLERREFIDLSISFFALLYQSMKANMSEMLELLIAAFEYGLSIASSKEHYDRRQRSLAEALREFVEDDEFDDDVLNVVSRYHPIRPDAMCGLPLLPTPLGRRTRAQSIIDECNRRNVHRRPGGDSGALFRDDLREPPACATVCTAIECPYKVNAVDRGDV